MDTCARGTGAFCILRRYGRRPARGHTIDASFNMCTTCTPSLRREQLSSSPAEAHGTASRNLILAAHSDGLLQATNCAINVKEADRYYVTRLAHLPSALIQWVAYQYHRVKSAGKSNLLSLHVVWHKSLKFIGGCG